MTLSERDRQVLFHPFTVFKSEGKHIGVTGAEAEFIITEDGRRIIDGISSWWLNLHGHNHPYINQKVKEQLSKFEHVIFAGFTHEPAVRLAERLIEKAGNTYKRVFLSDNGSTAVEVALKMAIQHSKNRNEERSKIIAFRNSYHGDTFGSMSVSEQDLFVKPFSDYLFDVIFIDTPAPENFARLELEFDEHLKNNPAAFIFEPLAQGAGGMRMYDAALLDKLINKAKKAGVVCIADEVMTGFGRTGSFFASDQLMHKPHLICLSKGLTGGYLPLGATIIADEIAQSFETTDAGKAFYHGHSFTGNPISCTAALASFDLMEMPETQEKIQFLNDTFHCWVNDLEGISIYKNLRCKGSIFAFDVETTDEGYFYTNPIKEKIYHFFIERDILIRPMGNVVYVMPPYCISEQSLQKIKEALIELPSFLNTKN